jgi:hypothetical protein
MKYTIYSYNPTVQILSIYDESIEIQKVILKCSH